MTPLERLPVTSEAASSSCCAEAGTTSRAARERGFLLITASCEEHPDRERGLVQMLLRRRVDALLLVPASHEHSYPAGGTPVIFLDRPPVELEANCVLLDNLGGARRAVEHLLAHGHERIAMVGDTAELYTAAERLAGYHDALRHAGVPVRDELIGPGTHDAAQAERVVRDFELADLLEVTVRHDSRQMGTQAAALEFERLDGADRPPRRVVVPTGLVARGSGELPPS